MTIFFSEKCGSFLQDRQCHFFLLGWASHT